MRKFAIMLLMATCLVACGDDDELDSSETSVLNDTENELWDILDGAFQGSYTLDTDGDLTETETLRFYPYSEPLYSSSIDGYVCGTVGISLVRQYESYSTISTDSLFYQIEYASSSDEATVSFYNLIMGYPLSSTEEKRNIDDWSSSSFKMWDYGTTKADNAFTDTKQ